MGGLGRKLFLGWMRGRMDGMKEGKEEEREERRNEEGGKGDEQKEGNE